MLTISIPGSGELKLEHLVLDYNGTLAVDGKLLAGVAERLTELAKHLHIHVITADTFGSVAQEVAQIPCQLKIIPLQDQDQCKLEFIQSLDAAKVVAIGNGRNDLLMLKEAALGIAVLQQEGAATQTLLAADLTCTSILDALDLLLHPKRLIATQRN